MKKGFMDRHQSGVHHLYPHIISQNSVRWPHLAAENAGIVWLCTHKERDINLLNRKPLFVQWATIWPTQYILKQSVTKYLNWNPTLSKLFPPHVWENADYKEPEAECGQEANHVGWNEFWVSSPLDTMSEATDDSGEIWLGRLEPPRALAPPFTHLVQLCRRGKSTKQENTQAHPNSASTRRQHPGAWGWKNTKKTTVLV